MIRKILAICCRDQSHRAVSKRLEQALTLFQEQIKTNTLHLQAGSAQKQLHPWNFLIEQAEKQGIAPLLFKHIRSLDHNPMPKDNLRVLQSLFLRNRRANSIRNQAMAVVLAAFAEDNIPVMAVKGIALANFAYTDPGLRSMRDIDMLVSAEQLQQAEHILLDLGYLPEKEHDIPEDYYHLVPMQKTVNGLQVTLEVHHNLLPFTGQYPPWPLEKSYPAALNFELGTTPARTLSLEETLWYVYLHGFQAPLTYEPFRFVHVADLITLVEKFSDTIDWQRVHRETPSLPSVLSCIHYLTPFSDRVIRKLDLPEGKPPRGTGQPYRGWPCRKLPTGKKTALPQLLLDTLWPAPWWLQIYYGHLRGIKYIKARMVDHPRTVWRWVKAFRHISG